MKRLAASTCLAFFLASAAFAQSVSAPELPRWTYENEVSFYKPLKGECQLFHRDTVGFAGANMAMTTCADDYRALWTAIEETTALSDKWILLQSIGDSGNSAGARMRLIFHERDKQDWAFIDRGEPGKEPMTQAPRRARAAAMGKLLSQIAKEDQIDDPELAVAHAATTYITVFDGEAIHRKAFVRTAKSKLPAADFNKLKALEDALWKLGPYYQPG